MIEGIREAFQLQGLAKGQIGLPVRWLLVLFLLAALTPLGVAAWTTASSGEFATEYGTAAAILAATLLYLQFLSSGRFEMLSGKIGIDRTMGFHRSPSLSDEARLSSTFAAVHIFARRNRLEDAGVRIPVAHFE